MEINKVHCMDWLDNILPDKCANLIIADPPYYKVKGDFDFIWSTFDDYLADVESWAKECRRLLADNGTLFWYGHAKNIAYSQIILDKYFNLENSLVWEKSECQTLRSEVDALRSFAPVTERILMYDNEIDRTGLEEIKLDINNFQSLRGYFKDLYSFIDLSKKEIISKVGQSADHCFRYGSTQWDLPTPETYNELIKNFKIDDWVSFKEYEELRKEYEELRKEYEELRKEYEELRRPFNLHKMQSDVLKYSQESYITQNYDHDTKKPETLTRMLINTCSRKGDLVVIPFAGSGTECAMSAKEGRPFIGFDVLQKYVDMSQKRADNYINELNLFN